MESVDGNALAGPLGEIFAVDITAAIGQCAHCGTSRPLAEVRVYAHAPGLVARCAECDEVVMRLVRGLRSVWLDLHGMLTLRVDVPED